MKKRRMYKIIAVAAALGVLAFSPAPADDGSYAVIKVYSGNAIKLGARTAKEKDVRVRYIGVDVPDKGKPFFEMCRNANKALVENKKVLLQTDNQSVQEKGKLLGYVYAGDVFVNAELIKNGYGLVGAPDGNEKHRELFLQLQQQAHKTRSGLWAFEDQSDEPYYVGSKEKKVFHRPSCSHMKGLSFDDRLIFRTKGEAMAASYRQDWRCCPLFKKSEQRKPAALDDDAGLPSAPLKK